MSHDEFERLAGSVFDAHGETRDRERLSALAAADPELRGCWEDLEEARAALGAAGIEPLPAGLHESLLASARSEPRAARENVFSLAAALMRRRPMIAFGAAAAAGLAIGVIGLGLLAGGFRAARDLAPGVAATLAPAPDVPATTRAALEHDGLRVALAAGRAAGFARVRLEARGDAPATVTFTWDPARMRLSGLRWDANDVPRFERVSGRLTLRLPEAAGTELWFTEVGDDGVVQVRSNAAGEDREVTLLAR